MNTWTMSEGHFSSWDGTELFYRAWRPQLESDKAIIVIHRGHEHSARVAQQIADLDLADCWAFSWDNRGHGHSPGERGHAESYYHLVKDLNAFVAYISATYGIPVESIALVANSVGAVTAATWVHDFAPRIRGMVMAAPAFRIRLYLPFAVPLLRLLQRLRKKATISSYVKSKMLTHDREQAHSYDNDPLITKDIAVNVLLGLHDTATRVMADAGTITTPTLLLSAGSDWVVKNSAQRRFYRRLSSPKKQMESYPGFFHALLYEKERQRPMAEARRFLTEVFATEIDRGELVDADRGGPTRTEYDLLRQPACLRKGLLYKAQRIGMKTAGRLSRGVRLGWRTGFDSGQSLDYVYENRPRGAGFIGRLIDRNYLDAIGWRGIRVRRENLERLLGQTLDRVVAERGEAQLLDLATGCGRYVLNVLKERPAAAVSACLRDFEPRNLERGEEIARELGLDNVRFEQGDAFSRASVTRVEKAPDIAIVSGLYELFPDNAPIRTSLAALADTVAPGGYLIYTCQPWHPQVEMIARVLDNREGRPWIMRRRSQAEMDELVRRAGFEKLEMDIDPWGIFSVSVARKVA